MNSHTHTHKRKVIFFGLIYNIFPQKKQRQSHVNNYNLIKEKPSENSLIKSTKYLKRILLKEIQKGNTNIRKKNIKG